MIKARILYKSCVDEAAIEADGIDTIMSLIDSELGGWPVLKGSSWNAAPFDLPNLLLKLRKYNNNFIYRIDTATDEKNSTNYDIEVSRIPVSFGPRTPEHLTGPVRCHSV